MGWWSSKGSRRTNASPYSELHPNLKKTWYLLLSHLRAGQGAFPELWGPRVECQEATRKTAAPVCLETTFLEAGSTGISSEEEIPLVPVSISGVSDKAIQSNA